MVGVKPKPHSFRLAKFLKDFDWAVDDMYAAQGRPFENFLKGSSIHFHKKVVAMVRERKKPVARWLDEEKHFIDLLYALLVSWGMDQGQARLQEFPEFTIAVRRLVSSNSFQSLEGTHVAEVDDTWKPRLRELWLEIEAEPRIMASGSTFVGGTKLLHHLLPDLVPPMDRTYTLDFMANLDATDSLSARFAIDRNEAAKPGVESFVRGMSMVSYIARQVPNLELRVGKLSADTSVPKIIDNAIVAWWGTQ